jgi:hypothetical protein
MKYTLAATSIQSLLELVNPNLNILKKGVISKSILSQLKKGATVKDAVKVSMKNITKEMPGEVVQETLQGISEARVNKMTNDIIGRDAFDDEFTAGDFAETALITILTTGMVSTPTGITGRNRLNDAAYAKAIEDSPRIIAKASELFVDGKMTEEQFKGLVDGMDNAKKVYDGMPEGLSKDAKIEIFSLINEKREVVANAEKGIVDSSLKERKDAETKIKTDVIDQEINEVITKHEPEVATEEKVEEAPARSITNEYASKEVDRVKSLAPEVEDGATMNLDGTKYEGGGLVVPLASKNMKSSELTTESINDFIDEHAGSISRDNVKVGIYKFPDSDQVSIDLNIVADPSMKAQALEIGKELGQESLFDLNTFENIKTGADGKTPKKLSPKELIDVQNKLSKDVDAKVESKKVVEKNKSKIDDLLGKKDKVKEEVVEPDEEVTVLRADNVNERIEALKSKAKTKEAKEALNTVSSVLKALEFVGDTSSMDGSINIHNTKDSYEKAVLDAGGTKDDFESGGFYEDSKGGIHLRPELMESNTILHEASHKVMASYLNRKPKAVEEFFNTLSKILPSATVKELNAFASEYGEPNSKEYKDEFVTEALADISNGTIPLTESNLSKVRSFIEGILEALGLKSKDINLTGKEDVKAYAKKLSKAFSEGRRLNVKGEIDAREAQWDKEAIEAGASAPVEDPSGIKPQRSSRGKVSVNKDGHELSFVTNEDLIDIDSLVEEIASKDQKVWFWAADQMGRGEYNDLVISEEHYLDAGPSYALDPENRKRNVIWATGKKENWVNKNIANSDYIFIMSGSPQKSKLFNARVIDLFSKRVGNYDSFKKGALEAKPIKDVREVLNNHKDWDSLKSSPDRKKFLLAIEGVKAKKATDLKSFLESKNAFIDLDSLRDGFYKDNNFEMNDVMIVLKPEKFGGKSNHSTYENDIIGEVVGVPDKKVNAYNLMPKGVKKEVELGKSQQSQVVAPYGSGIRKVSAIKAEDFLAGGIEKDMTVDGVDKKPKFQKKTKKPKRGDDLIAKYGNTEYQGEMNKSMMKDSDGDYLFYHYSKRDFEGKKIDPRHFGKNPITTDKRMHGISFYYTNPKDREGMVGSDAKVKVVKVAPHKVYPFNTDPLNFYDRAKKMFQKDFGVDRAFDPAMQASYIGAVAKKNGFEMVVAIWSGKVQTKKSLRGESQTALKFKEGNPKDAVKASKSKSKSKQKSSDKIKKTKKSLEEKSKPSFQRKRSADSPEQKKRRKSAVGVIVGSYGAIVGAKAKLEDATTGRLIESFENALAKRATKSLNSSNKKVREAAKLVTTFYNGIPRSIDELTKARELSGERAWSIQESKNLLDALYDIVGSDPASLAIVDRVMDPMFHLEQEIKEKYEVLKDVDLLSREDVKEALGDKIGEYDSYVEGLKVDNNMTIDSLSDEEKNLHDLIRNVNDMTHAMNHQMGLISDEVYEKHEGTYSGREYDFTENLPEDYKEALRAQNAHVNKMRDEIYKKRKDVTSEMVNAKIEDPAFTAIKRYLQTKQNAAVYQYGEYIASLGENYVSKEEKPGFKKMPEKGYGSLSGMWVTQHIAEDMVGYYFTGAVMKGFYEAAKAYDKWGVRQFLKKKLTVYNPKVIMGNYLSNLGFASAAGISPVLMLKNVHKAHKLLSKKESGSLFERLTRAGILGTDVITGDLKSGTETKKDGTVKSSKIKDVDDSVKKFYGYGDDLAKMTAYTTLVEDMGYNHEDAVKKVYNSFQNYQTVGKIWDLSAKFPVIGSAFIKFQADLQRIMYNKLKSPISALTFGLGLRAIVKGLSDDTEEEWEIRSKMRFTPKIFGMPLEVKVGKTTIDLSRFLTPYYGFDTGESGSWVDVVMENLPFTTEKMTDDSGRETSSSLFSRGDPLAGPLIDALLLNRDFRGKTINKEETGVDTGEMMLNSANFLARQYVPTYHIANDLYTTTERREDFYGRIRDPKDVLASLFIRVKELPSGWKRKTIESELFSLNMIVLKSKNRMDGVKKNYKSRERKYKNNLDEGQISKAEYDKKVSVLKEKAIKDAARWELQGRADSEKVKEFMNKWAKILHEDE